MNFVSIILGSKSDYEIMKNCSDTFDKFNVKYEMIIPQLIDLLKEQEIM